MRKVPETLTFGENGKKVNFDREALRWSGKGSCSQRESMAPLISVEGNRAEVKNAVIVEAPDGIHVTGKNAVLENLVFPKVCEDAITANGADNLIIRNCAFRGARDKAIQLNAGKNILIENCYFERCAKPIRVKAGVTVTVRNNVSRDSVVFVFADGPGARAVVENNDVKKSRIFVQAEKQAVVVVGENRRSKIEKDRQTSDGGQIKLR